jgi:ribosomal protein S18 acetylase RimI-like enzyme
VNGSEILASFDAEMRADPPGAVGVEHERDGPVVRSVGPWNVVVWWQLSEDDADAAVADQAARARAAGVSLEWKVYDHDGPPGIGRALERAGFVADPRETFMAFDLSRELPDAGPGAGCEIRRIVDAAGVDDFTAVGDAAFGRDNHAKAEYYIRTLDNPAQMLFVAYCDAKAVSAGRLELPVGRSFASIWGGGTVPEQRGRGLYRALVAHRAREAQRRGYRCLTVDAAPTSRPILERLGFAPLTGITGYVLRK